MSIRTFVNMTVQPMLPGHAEALEQLQRIVFPTLSAGERLRAEQYLRHLEIFPGGQFVLTTTAGQDATVIGMTSTMRTDFDLADYQHSFSETSGGGWLTRHQPEGEWLYGLDMGIHPDWRGRGGARLLYRARQLLVRRLGLAGQSTVGMMNGYGAFSDRLSGGEYYRQWLNGERDDPTLTRQRNIGFEPLGLIPDYLHDPACGNYGVLLRLDAGIEV
ncbi:hypothetical protein ACQ86N_21200 [Puia sp. P3]|uniref:hypothetical protein n=1 Tax=Puia sp. P3 TaxID=3423952 RepID=UPI003D67AAC7